MTSSPLWRVIIVNYQTGALAIQAARAAKEALSGRGEVIVVDSASGAEDQAELAQLEPRQLLRLDRNRGYGAALNAGVGDTKAEFLLCQNADVSCSSELLALCAERLSQLSTLGIVAPRLRGPGGDIQPSCRRFPTPGTLLWSRRSPLSRWTNGGRGRYLLPEPPSFTLCEVVAGACFAVRRTLWEELGGMDEGFFLYAEDTDFCRRAKSAGWLVGYEPAVSVQHQWGASTRQDPGQSGRRHAQGLARYFYKHYPGRPVTNRLLEWSLKLHARLSRS